MKKHIRKTNHKLALKERGQVLILVALAVVGIVAIIGLTLDVGMMFIEDARLRRAVDAAALAAALQYRVGVPTGQLESAAREFLLVNGVTWDPSDPPTVETCTSPGSTLCVDTTTGDTILRKLVRVNAKAIVHLAFLPVIGIDNVNISAQATGESASLDLVLVLDTSESMTYDAKRPTDPGYDPNIPYELRDPTVCNVDAKVQALGLGIPVNDGMPGECHPFEEVKSAAVDFINGVSGASSGLFFPYDRVTLVSFNKTATTLLDFYNNCDAPPCTIDDAAAIKTKITDIIKNLTVYDADGNVCPTGQPCLPYCTQANIDAYYCDWADPLNYLAPSDPGAVYLGKFELGNGYVAGPATGDDPIPANDPSQLMTTNIAHALWKAGAAFSDHKKSSSLWVVVLLTDGGANAGVLTDGGPTCPVSTWYQYRVPGVDSPRCVDSSPDTRHCIPGPSLSTCITNGNGLTESSYIAGQELELEYDADDSAHDWADYVGHDLGAIIFSIGLGPGTQANDQMGEKFLRYAAEFAGNGEYFWAPTTADLGRIFKAIGDKIATRLSQ